MPDTPYDALYDMPGHLIRRLHQISTAIFTARMAEAGIDLTSVQFAALKTVRENPGIDQATLAGLIAYDRVTIGGVVDRLVTKGLVSREVHPRDRRARVLELSPDGQTLLDRALPVAGLVQEDIVGALPAEDREPFVALLRRATEAANDSSRAPLVARKTEMIE
ncbi:DNA-binding MarR family transcriptional regulator [Amaricoccus macauensis]|uniref:DNA-binding MarR family transcriptional regulator n=1 Tax=Amaricoccus macauensis TaxID=57001 RepID=A0A840SNH5_9RHOB|nr:DNA-binding MarR family transcriptional regulator [Amaricoccus macauensis]